MESKPLEIANHWVSVVRQEVAAQEALIDLLIRRGKDTSAARELLSLIEERLAKLVAERDRLQGDIADPP
jgi:hypothetical protein